MLSENEYLTALLSMQGFKRARTVCKIITHENIKIQNKHQLQWLCCCSYTLS